jgi:hypothetical protein
MLVLSWSYAGAQGWRTFKAAKCEAHATLLHQNTADLAIFLMGRIIHFQFAGLKNPYYFALIIFMFFRPC